MKLHPLEHKTYDTSNEHNINSFERCSQATSKTLTCLFWWLVVYYMYLDIAMVIFQQNLPYKRNTW